MKTGFRDGSTGQDAEVIARLESGAAPREVAAALALKPIDLVAAVARDALANPGRVPGLVRGAPARPRLNAALSVSGIPALFDGAPERSRLALAAGLLQVHDFWDDSHRAAQEADDLGETAVSAYWHGIAHRREPDPGNAAYWFRRVGRHPLYVPLAEGAAATLSSEPGLAERLTPRGVWDPLAFVEICGREPRLAPLAAELQRVELRLLLGASVPT